MLSVVGETSKDPPLNVPPINIPPFAASYHLIESVTLAPVAVKEEEPEPQIWVGVADTKVGAAATGDTFTTAVAVDEPQELLPVTV